MPKCKASYYGVRVGRKPGVYHSWDECQKQVSGISNAIYKKFPSVECAQKFVRGESCSIESASVFYAVKRGHSPGIYTDWWECAKQIKGTKNPCYRKFKTSQEASAFMLSSSNDAPKNMPSNNKISKVSSSSVNRHKAEFPVLKTFSRTTEILILSEESAMLRHIMDTIPKSSSTNPNIDAYHHVVYCDGSCVNQHNVDHRRAGVGVFYAEGDIRNKSLRLWGLQTNQRAELWAAILAVYQAILDKVSELEVRTDSLYTINGATKWIRNWENNGFLDASGTTVKNKELFICLNALTKVLSVTWIHVYAHKGVPGNERADGLAKDGAKSCLQNSVLFYHQC